MRSRCLLLSVVLAAGAICRASAQDPSHGAVTGAHFTYQPLHASYPYLVYSPHGRNADRELPALLLIHGAGGNGLEMLTLWKELADSVGIVLIAPTFPLDEKFEAEIPGIFPALLDSAWTAAHFDRHRVYIFGYSAGGYTAFAALMRIPAQFAAGAVFASRITPDYAHIVGEAPLKTPIAYYVGDRDPYFKVDDTRRTRDLLTSNGFAVHYVELRGQDHAYGRAAPWVNGDAWSYMAPARR